MGVLTSMPEYGFLTNPLLPPAAAVYSPSGPQQVTRHCDQLNRTKVKDRRFRQLAQPARRYTINDPLLMISKPARPDSGDKTDAPDTQRPISSETLTR